MGRRRGEAGEATPAEGRGGVAEGREGAGRRWRRGGEARGGGWAAGWRRRRGSGAAGSKGSTKGAGVVLRLVLGRLGLIPG